MATTSIALAPAAPITFASVGDSAQVTATPADAAGHPTSAHVTLTSSDPTVATVDEAGYVRAVGNGAAELRASSGDVSASLAVSVRQLAHTVEIAPGEPPALAAPGDTARLTATAFDARHHPVTDATVAWSSSDAAIATVDAGGLVTARHAGTALLTATATAPGTHAPATATVAVVVGGAQSGVRVIAGNAQADTIGATLPLALVLLAADDAGKPVSGRSFIFQASAGGRVSSSGTTDAQGRVEARWTLGDVSGVQTVKVLAPDGEAPLATVTATARPGNLAALTPVSGDKQRGRSGAALSAEIVVAATDRKGNARPGSVVTFAVTRGGGTLSASTATTAADGRARVRWTLGRDAMEQNATASAQGLATPLTLSASVDASRAVYVDLPANAAVGDTVYADVQVDLSGIPSARRGSLVATLHWDGEALELLSLLGKADGLVAYNATAPGELHVAVSDPKNADVAETAFSVVFAVKAAAAGKRADVSLSATSLIGAGTFTELLERVSAVGGGVTVR